MSQLSFKKTSTKDVHIGKNGWLFLVAGSNSVLDLYRHDSAFTSKLAAAWVELLEERARRLNSAGIEYLHLPAPEKLTVMHENYLDTLENVEGSPIAHLFANYASRLSFAINPLPLFQSQRNEFPLYWKTDTHWTFWGCFLAYQLLCNRLGIEYNREILQRPFTESEILFDLGSKTIPATHEKARFYQIDKNAVRQYANPIVLFKENNKLTNDIDLHVGSHVVFKNNALDTINKKVVLFGDSFAEYRSHLLSGMLAETFREVHFIWNASIDYDYIARVKPDIVITELAERFMVRVPKDNLDIYDFANDRLRDYKLSKAV